MKQMTPMMTKPQNSGPRKNHGPTHSWFQPAEQTAAYNVTAAPTCIARSIPVRFLVTVMLKQNEPLVIGQATSPCLRLWTESRVREYRGRGMGP